MPKQAALWKEVTRLIDQKTTRGYGEAVLILVDLKDVAIAQEELVNFRSRVQGLQAQYSGRSALKKRMRDANLLD